MDGSAEHPPATGDDARAAASAAESRVRNDAPGGGASGAVHPQVADDDRVADASPPHAPVTDEEWEAFFRRMVLLGSHSAGDSALNADVLAPGFAPGGTGPVVEDAFPRYRDVAEWEQAVAEPVPAQLDARASAAAAAEPAPVHPRATAPETTPATLTGEDWREPFFPQRPSGPSEDRDPRVPGSEGDGGAPSPGPGGVRGPAEPASRELVAAFDWRDHDDLVLVGIVLDGYLRGISLESRSATVQSAVWGLAKRYSALIGRLAAQLPPR